MKRYLFLVISVVLICGSLTLAQSPPPGEGPALGDRITQEMVQFELSHKQIRKEGMRIFSTPFNTFDGLGDGPINPLDKVSPGARPTLQDNGMFLRINGMDSQTCLECHNIRSNATIPAHFAVGGVGGVAANALPGVIDPDINDSENNGFAAIRGRFINPPFSFGAGGIELLGKEMTAELQDLKAFAKANPGSVVQLVTKGVDFGSIIFKDGAFDLSGVEGIDDDLVVRPFGRKGCCFSVRDFDIGAMQFHHGIQPVEVVGEGVDADGDGVTNELTIGELSALHIFQISLERPVEHGQTHQSKHGRNLFNDIGCAKCHIPALVTNSRILGVSFPETPSNPAVDVFFTVDLSKKPLKFEKVKGAGVRVRLYADLKRHNMGPALAESTGGDLDSYFTTARLWGVADTAPYLHDGRAVTLTKAILMHGGEAGTVRESFDALTDSDKEAILDFLRTLRTPKHPNRGIR